MISEQDPLSLQEKKNETKTKKYSVKIASKNGNTIVSVYVVGDGGLCFCLLFGIWWTKNALSNTVVVDLLFFFFFFFALFKERNLMQRDKLSKRVTLWQREREIESLVCKVNKPPNNNSLLRYTTFRFGFARLSSVQLLFCGWLWKRQPKTEFLCMYLMKNARWDKKYENFVRLCRM